MTLTTGTYKWIDRATFHMSPRDWEPKQQCFAQSGCHEIQMLPGTMMRVTFTSPDIISLQDLNFGGTVVISAQSDVTSSLDLAGVIAASKLGGNLLRRHPYRLSHLAYQRHASHVRRKVRSKERGDGTKLIPSLIGSAAVDGPRQWGDKAGEKADKAGDPGAIRTPDRLRSCSAPRSFSRKPSYRASASATSRASHDQTCIHGRPPVVSIVYLPKSFMGRPMDRP